MTAYSIVKDACPTCHTGRMKTTYQCPALLLTHLEERQRDGTARDTYLEIDGVRSLTVPTECCCPADLDQCFEHRTRRMLFG
ncbi:hypothetical protein LCGC14_1041180 [marine sediment metagenome]|uniref:Uncharacterized protein n=1 Tax=marine sediment metagenome TaxID=412755 RepID=A0A0F9MRJ3_9ZZZZ